MFETSKIVKAALATVIPKVYPLMAPADASMPYAVYNVTKTENRTKDGSSQYKVNIKLFAANYDTAMTLADNIDQALAEYVAAGKKYKFQGSYIEPGIYEYETSKTSVIVDLSYNFLK